MNKDKYKDELKNILDPALIDYELIYVDTFLDSLNKINNIDMLKTVWLMQKKELLEKKERLSKK